MPGMNDIVLVGEADPLVQVMPVIGVAHQGLPMLGCHDGHHVHWQVALGLQLGKVLLVLSFTLNFGYVQGKLDFGISLCIRHSHVVSFLLLVVQLVFVLSEEQRPPLVTVSMQELLEHVTRFFRHLHHWQSL